MVQLSMLSPKVSNQAICQRPIGCPQGAREFLAMNLGFDVINAIGRIAIKTFANADETGR